MLSLSEFWILEERRHIVCGANTAETQHTAHLYVGDPKHPNVEDTVRDESSQIKSHEVEVETYNADMN